jgi:hypothetical protein
MKYWFKNKLPIFSVVLQEKVQEGVAKALQGMNTDVIDEFNCLLENSRKLYTF